MVDVKALLQDLAYQIQEGFGAERRDLRLDLEIAERRVRSDLAVPLTLFTVEALTNAFKHAYPPGAGGGVIRVSLLPVEDGKLQLTIEDDGQGLDPQDNSAQGIGSRLIQAFAQQIGGTPSVTNRPGGGTIVSLTFSDPLFEPRVG